MLYKNFKRCLTTENDMVKICLPVPVNLKELSETSFRFRDYICLMIGRTYGISEYKVHEVHGMGCKPDTIQVDLHVAKSELPKLYKFGIIGICLN